MSLSKLRAQNSWTRIDYLFHWVSTGLHPSRTFSYPVSRQLPGDFMTTILTTGTYGSLQTVPVVGSPQPRVRGCSRGALESRAGRGPFLGDARS